MGTPKEHIAVIIALVYQGAASCHLNSDSQVRSRAQLLAEDANLAKDLGLIKEEKS